MQAIRVAVLNDYSLPAAMAEVDATRYPAHHTWGVSKFASSGITVTDMPYFGDRFQFIRSPALRRLAQSLLAQFTLLSRQHRFDLVYSPCQSETWLLSRLRAFGLFRRPLVTLIHHPITGRLRGGKTFISGHDRLLFLSDRVRHSESDKYPMAAAKMSSIAWGADLSFYDQKGDYAHGFGEGFFVSAGKANRDHTALSQAMQGVPANAVVVCSEETRPSGFQPPNLTVIADKSGHVMSYTELRAVYRSARAIVIPLLRVDALAGLTSLVDAMACGKAVVMTRNPYIDVDIEALGFGIWVEPGDISGLNRALQRLAKDELLCREMGERARAYAIATYRYDVFSERVAKCLFETMEGHS